MEALEIVDPAFWADERPRVLAPPHLAAEGQRLGRLLDADGNGDLIVFASSGSSGAPKWVALRRTALRDSARSVNEHLAVSPGDRWLLALPAYHVGGFGVAARAREAGAALEVMPGKWNAEAFVAAATDGAATLTSLVPAQVHDLVAAGLSAPGTLRAVVVGGGALAEETGRRARDLGWPVLPSFGMTEAGSQIATASLAALDAPFAAAPIPVLPSWEVRASEDGLLEVRGAALFDCYLREEVSGLVREDPKVGGWFTTGDRVGISDRGIVPLGRADRRTKVLGELVDLDELESQLARGWTGAMCVVSLDDARRGARLVPVFEGASHPLPAELVAACNASHPGYARLEEPRFLDPWPRTPLGKTHYAAIRGELSLFPSS